MSSAEKQKYLQLVTKKLVLLTLGCLGILALFFYFLDPLSSGRTYLVTQVFAAGLIGGFLSIQQRLPKISLDELRELSVSWHSILLIPINGGVFAIVLHLMFLGGILEGGLFPKYLQPAISATDICGSFRQWLFTTMPATGPDIAKLIFWSFVAGFCERFVPQVIRKTAAERNENK